MSNTKIENNVKKYFYVMLVSGFIADFFIEGGMIINPKSFLVYNEMLVVVFLYILIIFSLFTLFPFNTLNDIDVKDYFISQVK